MTKIEEVANAVFSARRAYERSTMKKPRICVYVEYDFYLGMRAEVPSGGPVDVTVYEFLHECSVAGARIFPCVRNHDEKSPPPYHVAILG